ncbi:MAG: secondary thiamine-phosphate synthase enzyme YjbQ [Nitrospirales bacterium]
MAVHTHQLSLHMQGDCHIENMTTHIRRLLEQGDLEAGIVTIFVKHTTASVFIIEDEPGLRADTKTVWERFLPADPTWQHNTRNPGEDNGHSHLRGQFQGQSLTIPFVERQLTLGTWQEIVVIDFDTRARQREFIIQIIGE